MLAVDKGTFDAISLANDGKEARKRYVDSIAELLVAGTGVLVITSCNWTRDELREFFCAPRFTLLGHIDYRALVYGGQKTSFEVASAHSWSFSSVLVAIINLSLSLPLPTLFVPRPSPASNIRIRWQVGQSGVDHRGSPHRCCGGAEGLKFRPLLSPRVCRDHFST